MKSPVYNRLASWRDSDEQIIESEERLLLKKKLYIVATVIS